MTVIRFVKKTFFLILACFNVILSAYMIHFGYDSVVWFAIFSPVMFLPGFFTHKARNVYIAMLVSVGGVFQAFEIAWQRGGEIDTLVQTVATFYLLAIIILWIITEITLCAISSYKQKMAEYELR